jgi:hypothetical protein
MVKIEKAKKKQHKKVSLPVANNITINVERDGDTFRAFYNNKRVSEARGRFIQWCFVVEDYNICFTKKELEEMLDVD